MIECALIFLTRTTGISFGTLRLVAIKRENTYQAVLYGFIEMIFFCLATALVIMDWSNPWNVLSYAGGFSTGTFIAMKTKEIKCLMKWMRLTADSNARLKSYKK